MANNPYVNKVEYGGNTIIDLTSDTVTPNSMLRTATAHDAAGAPITGTLVGQEWFDKTEAQYRAEEAQSDPTQGTGVYDPNKLFIIEDMDLNGWVATSKQTATANSTTTLTFLHASIHPDSLILIAAEDVTTKSMPLQGHNYSKDISAKINYQDEGECQIVFDKQPNNTDFWLVIRNADDLDDSVGGSNAQNIYSTEESVIGRWIDGKPIYRKVIQNTTPGTGESSKDIDISGLSVDTLINIYGSAYHTETGLFVIPVNYTQESGQFLATRIRDVNSKLNIKTNGSWANNLAIIVILEYTKTTD